MTIFTLWLAACFKTPAPTEAPSPTPAVEVPAAVVDDAPERSTGCRADVAPVRGTGGMVASAHPESSRIGAEVLRAGGSAADAAVAMAVALTLVEPQSSGLGGGAFLLHYDGETGGLQAWDGRETAPRAATPDLFHGDDGPRPWPEVVPGGLSVGTPGLVRMLEAVHGEHGELPWAQLWTPTATLADTGFTVTPRMSRSIAMIESTPMRSLSRDPAAAAYFLPDGEPLAAGTELRNPTLADTVRAIAEGGADAFYTGPIAEAIVASVQSAEPNPGRLSLADLAAYRPVKREALCMPYGERQLCGHPPPTSGGTTVLQILGLLNGEAAGPAGDPADVHRFVEATRLAWADRGRYLGDPDAVGVPAEALVSEAYLQSRRPLIGPERQPTVEPGELAVPAAPAGPLCPEGDDTSHLVAIDAAGNVVSMTSSVEMAFGSGRFVEGFLLNNQLTDFDFAPTRDDGSPRPNAVAACKRPRSSMAPILVLDADGEVEVAVGSPGGSRIISYVARVLHHVLDQGLDMQAAISRPNVVARSDNVELEEGCGIPRWTDAQVRGLTERGHEVTRRDLNSGLQGIQRIDGGWLGGVDPRREGQVIALQPIDGGDD